MTRTRGDARERRLQRIPDDDIGHFLGFFGPVPWILYALCIVSFTYIALVLGGPSGQSILGRTALVVGLAALSLVVTPSPTPLPTWRTIVILIALAFVVAAVTWQQPIHDGPPRYNTWELALCDLMLFSLVIRARYLAAWIGQALMIGIVCLWSITVTGSPWYGFSFTYTQAFPLLAVTFFAIGLHRTARQITLHRTAERERAAAEARATAESQGIEAELAIVRDLAGPMLEQIASGVGPERAAARSLEAALRDLIRGRNLAAEPLVTTLRVVRERGIDITVLDDLGDAALTDDQRHDILTWSASQIARSNACELTLRLAQEDDIIAVTLAADGLLVAERHLR